MMEELGGVGVGFLFKKKKKGIVVFHKMHLRMPKDTADRKVNLKMPLFVLHC